MGKARIIVRPTPMLRKQIGQMAKLLGVWKKSKIKSDSYGIETKSCVRPTMNAGRPSILTKNDGLDSIYTSRRQVVLNRHYTEIITDVLSLDMRKEFSKFNVNITSIETKPNNKGIGIYYTTSRIFDQSFHDSLNSMVGPLTKAIAERTIIGRVPPISFVYDNIAKIDENLTEALGSIDLKPLKEDKVLTVCTSKSLSPADEPSFEQQYFVTRRFSAPTGMSNAMAGVDYPSLYNQIIDKQVQGRAKSSRMVTPTALADQKPLLRPSIEPPSNSDDPARRILQMQKFLVSQRKKSEYVAKLKRKQQLLLRDAFKWDDVDEA